MGWILTILASLMDSKTFFSMITQITQQSNQLDIHKIINSCGHSKCFFSTSNSSISSTRFFNLMGVITALTKWVLCSTYSHSIRNNRYTVRAEMAAIETYQWETLWTVLTQMIIQNYLSSCKSNIHLNDRNFIYSKRTRLDALKQVLRPGTCNRFILLKVSWLITSSSAITLTV